MARRKRRWMLLFFSIDGLYVVPYRWQVVKHPGLQHKHALCNWWKCYSQLDVAAQRLECYWVCIDFVLTCEVLGNQTGLEEIPDNKIWVRNKIFLKTVQGLKNKFLEVVAEWGPLLSILNPSQHSVLGDNTAGMEHVNIFISIFHLSLFISCVPISHSTNKYIASFKGHNDNAL